MAFLRHYLNGEFISIYELGDELSIGRNKANTVNVNDATVSGEHALISRCGDGYTLRDMDSTNGTKVNGQPVTDAALDYSSVITIGTHEFEMSKSAGESLEKTARIKKSWIPGVFYTER